MQHKKLMPIENRDYGQDRDRVLSNGFMVLSVKLCKKL